LNLTGAVVTSDAIGCQKAITRQIIQAKADHVLALNVITRNFVPMSTCGWTRRPRKAPWKFMKLSIKAIKH
jgi:hypothetical protein